MTEEIKNTAEDYDPALGYRDESAAPGSLADIFGLSDVPETEEEAWKEMWVGMPTYTPIQKPLKHLTVQFKTEEDFNAFVEMVGFKTLTPKTKSIWYPEIPKQDSYLMRFVDDE